MTRPFIAAILLLTFPASALAGSESDTIARLEQMERDIASLKASLAKPVQPAPRISPRYASAAKALLAYRYAAFGSPILGATISGGGGFSGGTVADATTFTSDVTFNGGTGALGFASGETLVPADGTLNVTGSFAASSNVEVTSGNLNFVGSAQSFVAANAAQITMSTTAAPLIVNGVYADGASATAVRISAKNDLVTAGAKIASFGDDAGVAYAEKAYIGLDGQIYTASTLNSGTITLAAGTGTATVRSGAVCVCTDTTANASVKCAVATTTLTATGTGTDVVAYWCN